MIVTQNYTALIRCHVYNNLAQVVGQASATIEVLHPNQGWSEIEPNDLWRKFTECIKNALKDCKLSAKNIASIGISTQRSTFVCWHRQTGQTFHNFITWRDTRSDRICKQVNNSFRMKCIRGASKIIYFLTRSTRYLVTSKFTVTTGMILPRLLWVLENIPEIRQNAIEGEAMFGTLDTFLVWKLTGGSVHATEPSNICISGFYDPFLMQWSNMALNMFNIPPSMLPIVQDTDGDFGQTLPELFGSAIPIRAVIGDQQAAMFGDRCFQPGDVKCTMGTGTFVDINTGTSLYELPEGMYPIVGWKLRDSLPVYLAEGGSYDTGTAICWGQNIGLFADFKETGEMAKSVANSGGVYFVPAFSGLQAPINDNRAAAAFIGITSNTSKSQLVRSILESIAFRVKQMFEIILEGTDFPINKFRINGGVAKNDFVIQLISDLTSKEITRSNNTEMSSLGVAFLAGLSAGFWRDLKELDKIKIDETIFYPKDSWVDNYKEVISNWERATSRCLKWYQ